VRYKWCLEYDGSKQTAHKQYFSTLSTCCVKGEMEFVAAALTSGERD
jgi:hypothetical protein